MEEQGGHRTESNRTQDAGPLVEPIPGERAAAVDVDGERAVFVTDYHAGYEAALRYERGLDVPGRAAERRRRLLELLERVDPDRLVILGDLMHSIGDPGGAERGELEVLFESFPGDLDVVVVKGNHDGVIETWLVPDEDVGEPGRSTTSPSGASSHPSITIVPGAGAALNGVGVCHGHTWPAPEVLEADVVCLGHEHPCVRLVDEVGGSRVEPAWLRGRLDPGPFRSRPEYEEVAWLDESDSKGHGPRIIVFPAFNELVGGTWVNVEGQAFLSPFLPDGVANAEAYLLDGTRLGPYRSV